MDYSKRCNTGECGGVGVIPRYSIDHSNHASQSSLTAGRKVLSPVSPVSPLESANQAGGNWSSTSQSSGGHSSPPAVYSYNRAPTTTGHHHPDMQLALQQIEDCLFLDDDNVDDSSVYTYNSSSSGGDGITPGIMLDFLDDDHSATFTTTTSITQDLIDRMSDPEQLLLLCAEAVSNANVSLSEAVISRLNKVVSIYGSPMQRLAAYMVEGLVARVESSGTGLCRALRCKQPVGSEVLSAMQVMYEVCPYIKFGYMAANGAIAEALKDEPRVHIIDFEIAQGTQYISLIQAMALRPNGPPHVRITGVGDPTADVAAPGGVEVVGRRLAKVAESVSVPFEFVPVPVNASQVSAEMLDRRPGEALAINFAMQLHHMPDESVSVNNPRDRLIRLAKSLGPKIVTLVEQEANTNTAPFLARFKESLSYYSAVFESLDVTLPRESRERVSVEQHCLARDLVNLIACEGIDRVERHEVMGKWRARMCMAGFRQSPLSSYVNHTISCLLRSYCDKYKLTEDNGVMYLGWLNRSLVVASAWS